jgi:hypothetical protein
MNLQQKLNSKLISLLNTKKTISHCFKVNNFTKSGEIIQEKGGLNRAGEQ